MGKKGEITKQFILDKAFGLFAENGFHRVTMKDICDRTDLSRGGLYRYYSSTKEIFSEIIKGLMTSQEKEITRLMEECVPAPQILDLIFERYHREMLDTEHSLSLAIYEFYSLHPSVDGNTLLKQYEDSKMLWLRLMDYGIRRKEFAAVETQAVFDLLVFAYQGIRMCAGLMPVDTKTPGQILKQIRNILIPEREDRNHDGLRQF